MDAQKLLSEVEILRGKRNMDGETWDEAVADLRHWLTPVPVEEIDWLIEQFHMGNVNGSLPYVVKNCGCICALLGSRVTEIYGYVGLEFNTFRMAYVAQYEQLKNEYGAAGLSYKSN